MTNVSLTHSEPLRLDLNNNCVWRGEQPIQLTPTAFALVRYLMERPGQVVTKDELLAAVWPEVVVSENTLTTHMGILRQALGDEARAPRYIETIHRRGYRFLSTTITQPVRSSEFRVSPQPNPSLQPPTPTLVGREQELSKIHQWWKKALNGERQLVFVTGEPGIGKSTLVKMFLDSFSRTDLYMAWGYCVESYGAGEAYLPVLTALDALCRTAVRDEIVSLLHQHAPTWLVQLPSLLSPAERQTLQYQLTGATTQRMLREFANFLSVLTATQPLILVLEDLHWSDPSTVALLSYLARWQEPLRLLLIGTYRPTEVLQQSHPLATLQQELQGQALCTELAMPLLTEAAVAEYLQRHSSQVTWPSNFARLVYQHTEGNPLFMVSMVEETITQTNNLSPDDNTSLQLPPTVQSDSIPDRLRYFVTAQMERLTKAEQQVLEAASVAGNEFSTVEIAAALVQDEMDIEEHCERLARQQSFLQPAGLSTWPDGTVAACYRFRHAVYQALWQEWVKARRWQQYHYRIGERKKQAYESRTSEIATELALHFEQGRDYKRAVQYLEYAGKNAVQRSAHREAIAYFTKGLELLQTLPDTPERIQQELMLQIPLGSSLIATKGFAAPEVGKANNRAQELCQQLEETPLLFSVLFGSCSFNLVRGKLRTAHELSERLFHLTKKTQNHSLFLEAVRTFGIVQFYSGELALAQSHLEESIPFNASQPHPSLANLYGGIDPRVHALSYIFTTLWLSGFPVQALKRNHEAIALAQELAHPFSSGTVLTWTAILYHLRREGWTVQEQAEALITFSKEKEIGGGTTWGIALKGWALAEQERGEEGITQIRQGLANLRAGGRELGQMYFLALLAEALGKVQQCEEGLTVLAEALGFVHKTGECWYEAELYRLRGEFTLQQESRELRAQSREQESQRIQPQSQILDPHGEAETCFLKAINIAQKQQAKSLELRATTSLARLWQQQGKAKQAHKMLSDIYNWFTEGFDTKDLQEAKALLEELILQL